MRVATLSQGIMHEKVLNEIKKGIYKNIIPLKLLKDTIGHYGS